MSTRTAINDHPRALPVTGALDSKRDGPTKGFCSPPHLQLDSRALTTCFRFSPVWPRAKRYPFTRCLFNRRHLKKIYRPAVFSMSFFFFLYPFRIWLPSSAVTTLRGVQGEHYFGTYFVQKKPIWI
jgi:hypothetical protein